VFVIRIPNSWLSPHRVELQGHNKFYTRGSNGKYPMDVDELRVAFNLSQTIAEKIKNFRIDRVKKINFSQISQINTDKSLHLFIAKNLLSHL